MKKGRTGEGEQERKRRYLLPHLIRGLQNTTNLQLFVVGPDLHEILKEVIWPVFFHSTHPLSNPVISSPFLIPKTVDAGEIEKSREEVKWNTDTYAMNTDKSLYIPTGT